MTDLSGLWLKLPVFICAVIAALIPLQAHAQGRNQPVLPQVRPQVYDPDPGSCVAERMRMSFQRQLEPFQDQSEAVLNNLRVVQAEVTLASLRRCVQRGLMPEEEAIKLAREFGLISARSTPPATGLQNASQSTRP